MDKRTLNELYAEIGNELIKTEPELEYLIDAPITIVYLESTLKKKAKGKRVLGQCEKVTEKYKWSVPADFTITLFAPNIQGMTEEQIRILLFHELMHIGKDYVSTRSHDLEDFKYIIDRFGVNWAEVEQI